MMKRPLLVLMLAFGMSACSDDGGSSGPAPVVNAKPTGIWRGCMTTILEWELKGKPDNKDFTCDETLGDGQHPMLLVSDAEGRFRIFAEMGIVDTYDAAQDLRTWTTAPFLVQGQVTTKKNSATGNLVIYSVNPRTSSPPGPDTLLYRAATLKGELTTADSWQGSITLSEDGLEYFKFDLDYDQAASSRGASLSQLDGIWQNADVMIRFQANGSFETEVTGQENCLYRGKIAVPDSTQNLYRLTEVQVDHGAAGLCTGINETDYLRGSYGGVAILVEENGIDRLKISLVSEKRMLTLDLQQ